MPRVRVVRLAVPVLAAIVVVKAGLVLTFGVGAAGQRGGGGEGDPTFYGEVLPILEANCQVCHQPQGANLGGMVAPMSFLTYEDTRPWAPLMAAAVKEGRMPPWHAGAEFRGRFENERYLEAGDVETLVAWVEAGAPAGSPQEARGRGREVKGAPKTYPGGWTIGEPDLIVEFPEPYLVGDDVHDHYVNIDVPLTHEMLPESRWIKAAEFIPGGPHVHHIIVEGVGGIAPGYTPMVFRDGQSRLLEAGRTLRFQMHYHKQPGPGTGVYDTSRMGVIFYEPGEVVRHVVRAEDLGIYDFVIPPGDPDYSASLDYVFETDAYITAFNPHMHLRGKAARFAITYPDGRHEDLLDVPRYDFNWQHFYTFRDPVFAPRGSTIHMTLWWDNSADNPHNPDHTIPVRFGLPTYAEMGFGFMYWYEAEPLEIVAGDPIPEEVLGRRDRFLPGGRR